MNKFLEWFTKRSLMFFSFSFVIIFFILYYINILSSCRHEKYCSSITELTVVYLLPFVFVFIFSLVTFKLKEVVFNSWRNFSIWAVPIIIIIVTFFPTRISGFDIVSVTKGLVMFFLTILYSIISFILIFYKSFKKE